MSVTLHTNIFILQWIANETSEDNLSNAALLGVYTAVCLLSVIREEENSIATLVRLN